MITRRQAFVAFGGVGLATCGFGDWTAAARPERLAQGDRDGFRRAPPAEVGVDADAVLAFLDDAARQGLELNSFLLYRNGAVAAEGWWWPYRRDVYHMLHSATKSFVGAGIGIAVDEGLLRLDDPVLKFFPGRIADPSDNLKAMTVEHLLTQTSGHAIGISGSQWRTIETSWVTEFLKVPVVHAPGTHFAYSSATSFMLSAIVTQVTGQSLDAYLRPRLFEPMGIRNYHWDVGPENINPGGNGLSTTTADFAKLGVMLMEGGKWNGRQIVPASWAAAIGKPTHGNPYGYQWWVLPKGLGYAAAGKFGQFSFVAPALGAVLTITAGVADNAETRNKMHALATLHLARMCPGGTGQGPSETVLAERTAALRLLPPLVSGSSPLAAQVSGKRIVCNTNVDQIKSLAVTFSDGRVRFEMIDHRGRHVVSNGLDDWLEGESSITGGYLHHEYEPGRMKVVAGARWTGDTQLEMTWQFIESGFRDVALLTFAGDTVRFDRRTNVNSGALARPTVTGRLTSARQR